MKRLRLIFLFAALMAGGPVARAREPRAPIVYFDLGQVLIDTSDENNFRYMPGAEMYLHRLDARGIRMGLITNVPDSWGRTRDEKIGALRAFVASQWRERRPFPWQKFESIVVPPKDIYRKPHPYMFFEAHNRRDPCRPYFAGEDEPEVLTARRVGFSAYWTREPGVPPLPPLHTLKCVVVR